LKGGALVIGLGDCLLSKSRQSNPAGMVG
jgi:hypothetical protein